MFTLAYRKIQKFLEILLDSPKEIPSDDTYVNMYIDNGDSLTTLDNNGNILEFIGEVEQ
jgi:hypothetical protein